MTPSRVVMLPLALSSWKRSYISPRRAGKTASRGHTCSFCLCGSLSVSLSVFLSDCVSLSLFTLCLLGLSLTLSPIFSRKLAFSLFFFLSLSLSLSLSGSFCLLSHSLTLSLSLPLSLSLHVLLFPPVQACLLGTVVLIRGECRVVPGVQGPDQTWLIVANDQLVLVRWTPLSPGNTHLLGRGPRLWGQRRSTS